MSDGPAIRCTWDGDVFKPCGPVWARRADQQFVVDQEYYVTAAQQRSENSHRHFFAAVAEAWNNLPEDLAKRWPTADHLRRYVLIKTGFYTSEQMVCPSEKVAHKVAAFMRPTAEYSVITVDGKVITRFDAKSQSYKAMGKDEFQRSKQATLDYLAELIGAARGDLEKSVAA